MMRLRDRTRGTLAVRCLRCGARYGKPATRDTLHDNPGCPRCRYLGWAERWANAPLSRSDEPWGSF